MQFASTELAAPTYYPFLCILHLLQIIQPACLVGLRYFVLPWPYLGPLWALAPLQRCLALLVRFWSCPFWAVWLRRLLPSALSLPLLVWSFLLGVLCALCVLCVLCDCVCCVYLLGAPAFAAALVWFWYFSAGPFCAPALLVLALVLFLYLPAPVC